MSGDDRKNLRDLEDSIATHDCLITEYPTYAVSKVFRTAYSLKQGLRRLVPHENRNEN